MAITPVVAYAREKTESKLRVSWEQFWEYI